MITAHIYVDDVVFSGIDYDAVDDTPAGNALRRGFYNYAHAGRDVLAWGGEPYDVVGMRNLQSYMKRIFTRMDDGTLLGETVRIELREVG